jgi:exosortase
MKQQRKLASNVLSWMHDGMRVGLHLIRTAMKTRHGCFVLLGLLLGICYLPVWLVALVMKVILQGSMALLIAPAALYLGLHPLWKRRIQLMRASVSEEDRFLGHLFIAASALLWPFCRFALWPQTIVWLLTLIGLACSSWGASFFRKHLLSVVLIALSMYPDPGALLKAIWQAITPPQCLERFMAWSGTLALQAIGQPAVTHGPIIALPTGAVEVNWGCSGFSMAIAMAATGLVIGLFYELKWSGTLTLVSAGIALALVFNIPRIMLLAIASVYWGKSVFNFWHGPIGGQLFTGILFTVYYYAIMWIIKRRALLPGGN